MRIICIDRALGNTAWVQICNRAGVNEVLRVKLVHQPQGVQAIAHLDGDEENLVRVMNCGIHRVVLIWIEHFMPRFKREAHGAIMEWEC
jgi:hypothetical protein